MNINEEQNQKCNHCNEELLRDLLERVERVEYALLGDEEMGHSGFIHRFQVTEERAVENSKRIDRIFISAAVIASVIAAIFNVLAFFI